MMRSPARSAFVPVLAAAALMLSAGCSGGSGHTAGAHTPRASGSAASGSAAAGPGTAKVLVDDLENPWALAFLPDGAALVTERDRAVLSRVTPDGRTSRIGRVPGATPAGEGGLMGVAVSPSYDRDGRVYLFFTARSDNRIARFRYDPKARDGGLGGLRPIVTGIPKGINHNGGRLAFGPDGMLYAATGEAGREDLSQDRSSLGGKILRMTPDGEPAPGNPFDDLVWTWGHRNVQGLAWDDDDRMYATEFGQNRFDEVNRIEKGRNYGWPEVEGFAGDTERFARPLLTWAPHEASPSGLAYAGGSLWAGALRGQRLWQVPLTGDGDVGRPRPHLADRHGRLRAVVPTPDGDALWVTTDNDGGDKIIIVPLR